MKVHLKVLALTLALAAPAMAQITNGGFELPNTAPPVAGEWQYNNGATRDGGSPRTGAFDALMSNTTPGNNVNVLQQTPFGSITPGAAYILNFYSKATNAVASEGQLQVGFMNSAGGYLPGSPTFTQIPASANYVLGTRTLTAPAGASAFFIAFNAVTGAVVGANSQLTIDDVSLSLVPEPTMLATLGLGGLMFKRRRMV